MNKLLIASAILLSANTAAIASDYYSEKVVGDCTAGNVRKQLDSATYRGRAVVTVVECEVAPQPKPQPRKVVKTSCNDCNPELEVVTSRKYFVKETREVLKPVVSYVSAGTYTTTREVCGNDVCK